MASEGGSISPYHTSTLSLPALTASLICLHITSALAGLRGSQKVRHMTSCVCVCVILCTRVFTAVTVWYVNVT